MVSRYSFRDWSDLPTELLELIIQRLVSNFVDIIRFRAVCKSWRFISLKKPRNPPPQLPWLMLSSDRSVAASRRFFSLSDNRVYSLPCGSCCSGSSHGWLFMEDCFITCSLFNPVTRVRINLPLIRSIFQLETPFDEWYIRFSKENQERFIVKAVLSSSPSLCATQACQVMLIFGHRHRRLAFCKLGDKTWTQIRDNTFQRYEDVVYFKGQFYAVNSYGRVVVCDLSGRLPVTHEFKASESFKADKTYLVELCGELLLIRRFRGWSFDLENAHRTVLFKVICHNPTSKSWVEVKTLRDYTLFLGYNQSLSLIASHFSGCKANCIYFTDNCFKDYDLGTAEPHDVGIYNLADGCIEPLSGYTFDSEFIKQPPIWITASPW